MGKSILDFTSINGRAGTEFTQVKGRSGTVFWCKPYILTLSSKPTGVDTITCYRYSSLQPGAATGTSAVLTNGSTIYHGDVIHISATASSGYKAPSVSSSTGTILFGRLTVDGNESITVTAGELDVAPVYITAGTGVSSVFLSTNPSTISGSASGSNFSIGSTVYGFVVLKAGYNPKSSWTLVSEAQSVYRVGSKTVVTSGNDFGTQSGSLKYFTISFSNPLNGYWNTTSQIANVPYGTTVSVSGNTVTINGVSRTLYANTTGVTTSVYYTVSSVGIYNGYVITDNKTIIGSIGSANKTYGITFRVSFMYANPLYHYAFKNSTISGRTGRQVSWSASVYYNQQSGTLYSNSSCDHVTGYSSVAFSVTLTFAGQTYTLSVPAKGIASVDLYSN